MMADVEEVEVVLAHHEPSRTDRLARLPRWSVAGKIAA